jgi:hypothetical protein
MGQLSHISGVEFHHPDSPDMHIRLMGDDGLPYDLSTRDMFDLSGGIPWSDYWKMFCPRLPSGTQLRILIAAVNTKDKTAPKKLRAVGGYEVVSDDRNKVVRFDKILDVERVASKQPVR